VTSEALLPNSRSKNQVEAEIPRRWAILGDAFEFELAGLAVLWSRILTSP